MDATRQVVIVGAGPTGAVTALLLGDLGIDCLVIDKRTEISPLPRARGIHARASEILRQLRVEQDMTTAALPIRPQMQVRGPLDQPPAATIPTGGADFVEVSPCEGIAIAQDVFENVLRDHLARRPSVELRLGTRAGDLEILPDGTAVVGLEDTVNGGTCRVHAAYVVAADGWRSEIRTLCGIGFEGAESLAALRGVLFKADLTPWLGDPPPAFVQLTHVPGVLMPTHPDHRWGAMRFHGPAGAGPADAVQFIHEQLGIDVTVEPLGDTRWSVGVQWASTMQHGPVLLAGDAAHRVTPQGAGGISMAMADAHNLAWKLAAVLRGWGGPGLLQSYNAERSPVNRGICTVNQAMWTSMVESGSTAAPVDLRMLDMGYRYVSDLIIEPDAGAVLDTAPTYTPSTDPGGRAPHAWLDDDHRQSTLDAFGRGFVLVCHHTSTWPQTVARYQDAGSVPVALLPIDRADVLGAYGLSEDETRDGAVLVRPDGHIAWRTPDDANPESALRHALRIASGNTSSVLEDSISGDSSFR